MKNIIIAGLLHVTCLLSLTADCSIDHPSTIRIPTQFSIREQWFTSTTTYEIADKNGVVGTLRMHPIDFSFEFLDLKGANQGTVSMIKGIPQAYFILNDVAGDNVGDLREEESFFHTFSLISPTGDVIGIAKQNFWGTQFTITGPETGYHYATVAKYPFRNKWEVTIDDPIASFYQGLDPRLYVVLVAVKQSRAAAQRFIIDPLSQSVEQNCLVKMERATNQNLLLLKNISDEDVYTVETVTEPLLSGLTRYDTSAVVAILSPLLDDEDTRLSPSQKEALKLMMETQLNDFVE